MNYFFATAVCAMLWFFWGLHEIYTGNAIGPAAVGAAFACLVAPLFLGLIPYSIAGLVVDRKKWPRYTQPLLVLVIIYIFLLVMYSVEFFTKPESVSYNVLITIPFSLGAWLASLTFGIPLFGRLYINYLNDTGRLPKDHILRMMFTEWWRKTGRSNQASDGMPRNLGNPQG